MEIKELEECFRWIEAVRTDEFIMFGVISSIERYGGRNLPYYLSWDFLGSVSKEEYPGPHPSDYDIGYYGGPEQTEGSRKFVFDACAYAEKEWKEELADLETKLQAIVANPHF